MAGWTKADYDAAYSIRAERHFGGAPNAMDGRAEVRVNYHKVFMAPSLANRWARLAPILNLQSTDDICVAGCGFGWGVDGIIAATGADVVGVDISDYIAAEQSNTETTELRAAVSAVGLDPDSGRGLELMGFLDDNLPRANIVILQSDMSTSNERQQIRAALGGSWPNVVIFEDMVDDTFTDTDIINARNAGNGFGGAQRLIWLYTETAARTYQDLADLTGNTVVSPDGAVLLNP